MKTYDELVQGLSVYEGLGWYFCRDGNLAQIVFDWRTHLSTIDEEYSILGVRERTRIAWAIEGRFFRWRTHDLDLILYVGPDEPAEKTLAEYLEARKPKPVVFWINEYQQPDGRITYGSARSTRSGCVQWSQPGMESEKATHRRTVKLQEVPE